MLSRIKFYMIGAFVDEIPGSTSQKRTPLLSDLEGSTKRSKLMGDRGKHKEQVVG